MSKTDKIINMQLAEICDKYNLVTQMDIVCMMYRPITWDDVPEKRCPAKDLMDLYIHKIRWAKLSVFEGDV